VTNPSPCVSLPFGRLRTGSLAKEGGGIRKRGLKCPNSVCYKLNSVIQFFTREKPMSENDRIVLKAVLEEQKADKAPDLSDNAYFEIFTAEHILKNFDLSYDEIQSGQVGAGGDGGIDTM